MAFIKQKKPNISLTEKEARLEVRLNEDSKILLQQVYKKSGYKSLSAFVLQAALEKAEQLIHKEKMILSSERDKNIFFSALLNTSKPNDALIKAAKNFKDQNKIS